MEAVFRSSEMNPSSWQVEITTFVFIQNFFLLVDNNLEIKCQPIFFDFFNS